MLKIEVDTKLAVKDQYIIFLLRRQRLFAGRSYPAHFATGKLIWPIESIKKYNAFVREPQTEKWLYPNGYYCVVRRFSSKEEKRRVVASVVDPIAFGGATSIGFENHLNLFHKNKSGLEAPLAHGLAAYLNSTAVDDYFRRFNGHTQVNATDLKLLKYPSRESLIRIGVWAMQNNKISQSQIDEKMEAILSCKTSNKKSMKLWIS